MASPQKIEFVVNPRVCQIPKSESFWGDRRFAYKNWWCLSAAEKEQASGRYPHKVGCIPDSAYAYPFKVDETTASARRFLVWGRARVARKCGRAL